MKKKKNRIKAKQPQGEETLFIGSQNTASAMECTGLIPTPALSEDEQNAFGDLYDIPLPEGNYPHK